MTRIRYWNTAGAAFGLLAGTLLHFVYEWFGGSFWAVVGAVNESTWEHLKLLFFPILLFGILEYLSYGKDTPGFLPIKTASILLGMGLIVVLFYTYTGILGFNWAPIDISLFIIGILAAYWFSAKQLEQPSSWALSSATTAVSAGILLLLLLFFIVFTFSPPEIGLFLDPVTGKYGLAS